MFMTDVNDVKIYNLSAGKSLPDWLSDQKRRKLINKNVDLRKRIELIQDFDMPDSCQTLCMSPNDQFIIATGVYKPRIKCFDVNNLSEKFERCFDSEVVATEVLSDDYSKLVFLQNDRFVEIHAPHGRHYRLRIPRFGYDMKYHTPSCDLFLVGASPEIYRLNLERGQFLQSLKTQSASAVNRCVVNPEHHLLCVGTQEGRVEAWDPRDKTRVGTLDVAAHVSKFESFPSVTSMQFKDGLHLGVGTHSGHVLLFDVRAKEPLLVKDHLTQSPIKRLDFNPAQQAVYSMDQGVFKIWHENTGKQIAYVESESGFNDFASIRNTGLMFFAQDDVKMLSYYIPSMGAAPRWCSFLDNLTEEIESESVQDLYDDYKFITRKEMAELGLEHLEGSNLLRAYMHGFFIDIRLHNKAKAVVEPFAFERYRKDKIRQQVEANRPARLKVKSNLPAVNQELALKYMDDGDGRRAKTGNLLQDDRFAALFSNPEFEVNKNAEEYKMLTPVLSRLDKGKVKALKRKMASKMAFEEDEQAARSSDDDLFSEQDSAEAQSSDDEDKAEMQKDLKRTYRQIRKESKAAAMEPDDGEDDDAAEDGDGGAGKSADRRPANGGAAPVFKVRNITTKLNRKSLGARLATPSHGGRTNARIGNTEMSFDINPRAKHLKQRDKELKIHREERKKVIRPIKSLHLKKYVEK